MSFDIPSGNLLRFDLPCNMEVIMFKAEIRCPYKGITTGVDKPDFYAHADHVHCVYHCHWCNKEHDVVLKEK